MIETPTVLILGAGASTHVDYPLGRKLVNDLCSQKKIVMRSELPMGWTSAEVDQFLTRLSRAGHYSIDAYLETVPHHTDLGKYLIAREMKGHENIDRLFSPNDPGWYQYIFNRLLDGNSPSGFESSQLSIITFNYDRSLEVYLHEALVARFEMTPDEAAATLSHVPIIHVHGSMGEYPDIPYESQCDIEMLLEISRKIQIIHEVSDPSDGFCNREFEQANKLLHEAERVLFFGFGFHPDNIRRFNFFTPENTEGREIRATTSGMGAIDVDDLVSRLKPLGIKSTALNGSACNNFFSQVTALK